MFAKPASPRLQSAHPLARGLIAAWLFTEHQGTSVLDRSRYSPGNGTTSSGQLWQTSMLGPNLNFNGTSQLVTIVSNVVPGLVPTGIANIASSGSSYSFFAYMKSSSTLALGSAPWAVGAALIEFRDTGGGPGFRGWSFGLEGGVLAHGRSNDPTTGQRLVATTTISDSVYRSVAAVVSGNNVTFYVAGQVDGTGTFNLASSTGDCSVATSNTNVYGQLGCRTTNAGAAATFFAGNIDNLQIFNRTLSFEEITQLDADPYIAWRHTPRTRRIYSVAAATAKQYAISVGT